MPIKSSKKKTTSKYVPHVRVIVTTIALILVGGGASVYAYSVYHANLTAAPDTVVVQPTAVDPTAATTTTPHSTVTTPTTPTSTTPVTPAPSSQVPSLSSTSSGGQTTVSSYQSNNWAGYLSTGSNFTSVSGSWVVPDPAGTSLTTESGDATWVGLGGVTSSDLLQIGTENSISATGVLTTAGFYELVPASAHTVLSVPIHPEDQMSASITQTATNTFTISLTDITSSQSFSLSVNYASSLSSAEWIQEDPAYPNGSLVPLDDYRSVPFTNAWTTMGGTNLSAAASSAVPIIMSTAGKQVGIPSGLTDDSFTVTRG
jgi:hypothetical protein